MQDGCAGAGGNQGRRQAGMHIVGEARQNGAEGIRAANPEQISAHLRVLEGMRQRAAGQQPKAGRPEGRRPGQTILRAAEGKRIAQRRLACLAVTAAGGFQRQAPAHFSCPRAT